MTVLLHYSRSDETYTACGLTRMKRNSDELWVTANSWTNSRAMVNCPDCIRLMSIDNTPAPEPGTESE